MDRFSALSAFIAVVEAGSFQAAGDRLGVAKSVVSRRVSDLEKQLGSRLMNRTTRSLSLTDEGRLFYKRSVQILNDLEDAENELHSESSDLKGRFRLAAPLSFGLAHLSEAISAFLDKHQSIELDLDLNDRHVNLVEEGFDMAVRIGELKDSNLVARKLAVSRSLTCASPAYLTAMGEPSTPDELKQHVGLQYSNVSYKSQWRYLAQDGSNLQGQPQIRMRANNGEVLVSSAVAGRGIFSGPSFILGTYIRSGHLVRILDGYAQQSAGIYAIYPPGRLMPHRVRVFSDYLQGCFGDQPYWDEGLF